MTKFAELKKHEVILVCENTDEKTIELDAKELPTDVHLVQYKDEDTVKIDAVRAFKMSDIFDAYWDFGIKNVSSIRAGYGNIRPNLYTAPTPKDD